MESLSKAPGRQRRLLMSSRRTNESIDICVSDNGVGFGKENEDRLFDAFFTARFDGMGIGLAITRSIIESHGGRCWAANNSDQGATFSLQLPVAGNTSDS